MKVRRFLLSGVFLGTALLFPFIVRAEPLQVVATFTILADITREIGGENVAVRTLVGPNGDAHVFEPTPGDARAVAEADLLVMNGLGIEGWMERLTRATAYKGPVVIASAGVKVRTLGGGHDPHAWQDLSNGRLYAANIAEGLAKADPERAAVYRAKAERYSAELAALDAWTRSEIGAIPEQKRRIITQHDAFGYFAAAYGVTVLAPEGLSTEAEPTAKGLGRLIKQIRATRIKALFVENMADPRQIEQLAKEAGASIGGTLYVDALSPPDGPAASYTAMFKHNVRQIKDAMQRN